MKPKIIAFVGRKYSGKTSASRHIQRTWPGHVHIDSLATPIRDHIVRIFGPMGETPKEILRPVMQTLGEALKLKFGNDCFLELLQERLVNDAPGCDIICIDDIRYPFEADWVSKNGGTVVRVIRPGSDDSGDTHSSETAVDTIVPDVTIINESTLESFLTKVTNTLES